MKKYQVYEYDTIEKILVLETDDKKEAFDRRNKIYGRSKNGYCKQWLIYEDGKLINQGMPA